MSNKNQNQVSLLKRFESVRDVRITRHQLYPLAEILFLTVNAVISGYSEWEEIVDFGEEKLNWLRVYLPYENGIPSHDTINRVIGLINYRDFEIFFISWIEGMALSLGGKVINIDGKKLRGSVDKGLQQKPRRAGGKSAIHLVEVWCSALNLCLGQYKTEDKSNEITAIPALIDLLEISGSTVTIDAMGCQKTIASKIIDKEADYILGLKGNQEAIHQAVKALFEEKKHHAEISEEETLNHGRYEIRQCRILSARFLEESMRADWKGLNMLIEIESERLILATEHYAIEYRYYLGSKTQSAEDYNQCE